jgi:hypothetical protein
MDLTGAAVYLLCALTSIVCAVLLLRSSRQSRTKLLLWTGWGFACLALGNVMLFVDLVLTPNNDLLLVRNTITLSAIAMMLYGLIWETE